MEPFDCHLILAAQIITSSSLLVSLIVDKRWLVRLGPVILLLRHPHRV